MEIKHDQEWRLLYSSGKQSFKELTQLNACGCSTAFILSPCNLSFFCLTLVRSRLSFTSWTKNKKHLLYRLFEIVPKHEITKTKLTVIFLMMAWVPWNCWPSKVSMDTSVFKRKTNTSALSWENSSSSPNSSIKWIPVIWEGCLEDFSLRSATPMGLCLVNFRTPGGNCQLCSTHFTIPLVGPGL